MGANDPREFISLAPRGLIGRIYVVDHKLQPFPDTKKKRKPTKLNKHKSISSLFPKRGNRNAKRSEKHKNKTTQGKTQNNRLVE